MEIFIFLCEGLCMQRGQNISDSEELFDGISDPTWEKGDVFSTYVIALNIKHKY